MRIALFPSAFHPHFGGVEELSRQLAHALIDMGHQVSVFTNQWPRSLPEYEEFEGIPIHRIPMRTPIGGFKAVVTHGLTHGVVRNRIRALLRTFGAEVLHVQCVSSNAYYAAIAAKELGIPLVVTAQGELTMDAAGLFQQSEFARRILRDAIKSCSAVTACSAQTLCELEQFYSRSFDRPAQVVYNGIRLKDFDNITPHCHGKPYILGIGRHVHQKGFDVLIRAFAQLVQHEDCSHDLILAGDGPEHDSLRKLAGKLVVEGKVHFPGQVGRPAAASLFLGSDLFVLPSRHEPFGIVNLEAMAARTPVIATRVGGVPEIVRDGESGVLVPPEDPDALADAMKALLSNRAELKRLSDSGREFAEAFDWRKIALSYQTIYSSALSGLSEQNFV